MSLTTSDSEPITRLGSMSSRWRCYVRRRDVTPPFDALPPIEVRALSEAMALDLLATWKPDLEVLSVTRCPSLP